MAVPLVTVAVSVFAFLTGAVCLYLGKQRWQRTQLLKNTPTAEAHSAAVGRTELEGEATPIEDVLDQPFDDGKCVYAWYQVDEYHRGPLFSPGRNNRQQEKWEPILHDELAVPFAIDDGTETVYVDLSEEPEFHISDANRTRYSVGSWNKTPDVVERFLSQYNVPRTRDGVGGILDGVRRRYRQSVLPLGDTVYVFGSTRENENGVQVIGQDAESGEFMISDQPADEFTTSLSFEAAGLSILGTAFLTVGFYVILFGLQSPF